MKEYNWEPIKKELYKEKYQICYTILGLEMPPFIEKKDVDEPSKNKKYLYIGHIFPGDNAEMVSSISKYYTDIYDKEYKKNKDNYNLKNISIPINSQKSVAYTTYIKTRFINYAEYKAFLNTNFDFHNKDNPSYFLQHKNFPKYCNIVLGIKSLSDYQFFIREYQPNVEGYKKFLKNNYTKFNKGLYLFLTKEKIPLFLPYNKIASRSYVVGKSGSGKSEVIKQLIYNHFNKIHYIKPNKDKKQVNIKRDNNKTKDNLIVIDPHGDLAQQVAKFKGNNIKNTTYLAPALDSQYKFCINPFDIPEDIRVSGDEIILGKIASSVTEALAEGFADLTENMKNIMHSCIGVLLQLENTSILELRRFMDTNQNDDLVKKGQEIALTQATRDLFKSFNNQYKRAKKGIMTRLDTLLNNPFIERLFVGKRNIDFEKLLNHRRGQLIVINLSKGDIGGEEIANVIGKVILGIIASIFYQRNSISISQRIPTHIFIDEFPNFVTKTIFNGLTELRKYKANFNLAAQIVGQKMKYEETQTLLSGTPVKFVGRLDSASKRKIIENTKLQKWQLNLTESEQNKGVFGLQLGPHSGVVFQGLASLLDNKNSMSNENWSNFIKETLRMHYMPVNPTGDFKQKKDENKKKNKAKKNKKERHKSDDDMLEDILIMEDIEFDL